MFCVQFQDQSVFWILQCSNSLLPEIRNLSVPCLHSDLPQLCLGCHHHAHIAQYNCHLLVKAVSSFLLSHSLRYFWLAVHLDILIDFSDSTVPSRTKHRPENSIKLHRYSSQHLAFSVTDNPHNIDKHSWSNKILHRQRLSCKLLYKLVYHWGYCIKLIRLADAVEERAREWVGLAGRW